MEKYSLFNFYEEIGQDGLLELGYEDPYFEPTAGLTEEDVRKLMDDQIEPIDIPETTPND